jgi:hypothetical protein
MSVGRHDEQPVGSDRNADLAELARDGPLEIERR